MSDNTEIEVLQLVEAVTLRPVGLDEPLLEMGLVDSISAVDLALELERHFDIEIPAVDIHRHMRTVRSLIEYLRGCKRNEVS